jgi:hypothetical protein
MPSVRVKRLPLVLIVVLMLATGSTFASPHKLSDLLSKNHALSVDSSKTSCSELGFSEELRCATCDLIYEHLFDDALMSECVRCCSPAVQLGLKVIAKFTGAYLQNL